MAHPIFAICGCSTWIRWIPKRISGNWRSFRHIIFCWRIRVAAKRISLYNDMWSTIRSYSWYLARWCCSKRTLPKIELAKPPICTSIILCCSSIGNFGKKNWVIYGLRIHHWCCQDFVDSCPLNMNERTKTSSKSHLRLIGLIVHPGTFYINGPNPVSGVFWLNTLYFTLSKTKRPLWSLHNWDWEI